MGFTNSLLKRADMLKLGIFLFALVAVKADGNINYNEFQPEFNSHQQQSEAPQVVEAKQFRESIDSYGAPQNDPIGSQQTTVYTTGTSDNYSGGGWAPVSSNNGWGAQAIPYNSGNIGFGYGSIFNKILYGIILLLAITSVGQLINKFSSIDITKVFKGRNLEEDTTFVLKAVQKLAEKYQKH